MACCGLVDDDDWTEAWSWDYAYVTSKRVVLREHACAVYWRRMRDPEETRSMNALTVVFVFKILVTLYCAVWLNLYFANCADEKVLLDACFDDCVAYGRDQTLTGDTTYANTFCVAFNDDSGPLAFVSAYFLYPQPPDAAPLSSSTSSLLANLTTQYDECAAAETICTDELSTSVDLVAQSGCTSDTCIQCQWPADKCAAESALLALIAVTALFSSLLNYFIRLIFFKLMPADGMLNGRWPRTRRAIGYLLIVHVPVTVIALIVSNLDLIATTLLWSFLFGQLFNWLVTEPLMVLAKYWLWQRRCVTRDDIDAGFDYIPSDSDGFSDTAWI